MKRHLILLFAVILFAVIGCADSSGADGQGVELPVYFLAHADSVRGGDMLQCSLERFDLSGDATTEEIAVAVVKRMLSGSEKAELFSPFPQGTELLSLTIRNGQAYVDLSGILRMGGIDLTLADYCLTLTLTAIDGIDSVSVTGNGRVMAQQPRRFFYPRDVLLSSEDSVLQQIQVALYFLNEDGVLTPEIRTLDIYEGETQSAVLITALLAGPKNSDLSGVIPDDFQISSIKVENGICRINLLSSVLQNLPQDEYTQNLILWSLAESLYSLDYIREIRLMADGEELEKFGSVPVTSIGERPQG